MFVCGGYFWLFPLNKYNWLITNFKAIYILLRMESDIIWEAEREKKRIEHSDGLVDCHLVLPLLLVKLYVPAVWANSLLLIAKINETKRL